MTNNDVARDVQVLVLGAGVCGIAAVIGCQRAGIDDVVVIERADAVGGTWHHNTYPGCAVDIPSHVYSFSYAPNPNWSRVFAPRDELKQYLVDVVEKFGIARKIMLGVEMLDATWGEAEQRWIISTSAGVFRARAFVAAAGPLHEPIIPNLPGLADFAGECFHSSQWPADLDLAGKRVVVIGTGASAIQFVPRIARQAAHVTVLQRTPSWVMPKPDWPVSSLQKRVLRRAPFVSKLLRWGIWAPMDFFYLLASRRPWFARSTALIAKLHMRRSIKDKALRRALTPTYAPTCKRLGLANDYYQTFTRANVELITEPAARVDTDRVITADGREIVADVLILGTGFHTMQHHPVNRRVHGRDGRSLDDVWAGNPTAYLGTTVHGFPNAFVMFGPNIGTLSGFVMAEAQTDYIVGALKAMRARGLTSLDVRREAQVAFVAECDEILRDSTFAVGGCSSYYLSDSADAASRVSLVWPWTMGRMRRRLKHFDIDAYRVASAGSSAPASADALPGALK